MSKVGEYENDLNYEYFRKVFIDSMDSCVMKMLNNIVS